MKFLWHQVIYGQTQGWKKDSGWFLKKLVCGLSVMIVPDLLHLPPNRWKSFSLNFSNKDSINHLLSLQLWHSFKYAELTKVVRQNYELFINLYNVWVGKINDDAENLLKARFIINPGLPLHTKCPKRSKIFQNH